MCLSRPRLVFSPHVDVPEVYIEASMSESLFKVATEVGGTFNTSPQACIRNPRIRPSGLLRIRFNSETMNSVVILVTLYGR
jgi:hypothetical protein